MVGILLGIMEDGMSMSMLGRFLLYESWFSCWSNCIQASLLRWLSDHCPILLTINEYIWGPRPQRLLKYWTDLPGYKEFIKEK